MTDPRVIAPASERVQRNWVGRGNGNRRIVEVLGLTRRADPDRAAGVGRLFLVRVVCSCGREDLLELNTPSKLTGCCVDCGRELASRRNTDPGLLQTIGERNAFVDAAHPLCDWREDTAEARIAESVIAAQLGRMTLDEVGRVLGFSRERARQLEKIALGKLRRALEGEEHVAAARRAGVVEVRR